MSTKIGSYEAKTRLPELLRAVRKGRSYTITKRGEAVAELVPVRAGSGMDTNQAVQRMLAFMRDKPVVGVDIKELLNEGRA